MADHGGPAVSKTVKPSDYKYLKFYTKRKKSPDETDSRWQIMRHYATASDVPASYRHTLRFRWTIWSTL